jgi:hypothetical protein
MGGLGLGVDYKWLVRGLKKHMQNAGSSQLPSKLTKREFEALCSLSLRKMGPCVRGIVLLGFARRTCRGTVS